MKKAIFYSGIILVALAMILPSNVMADDNDTATTSQDQVSGSAGNIIGLTYILPAGIIQDITAGNSTIDDSGTNNLEGGGDGDGDGGGDPIPPDNGGDDLGWDTHNG